MEILYNLDQYSTLIIIAETGSGKTTQIPQFLYEAGYTLKGQCIAVTEPRRMACISLAERVAQEMRSDVGSMVGYKVRFSQVC